MNFGQLPAARTGAERAADLGAGPIRPLLLDLFCGAGGCSVGYSRAGFDVVGVDLKPQPHYPFEFHQLDAMEVLEDLTWARSVGAAVGRMDLGSFDAIHASPPCQAYSKLRHSVLPNDDGTAREYPNLVAPTRRELRAIGLPYVIENVVGAPLYRPLALCGSMFGLGAGDRYLERHRLFECSFPIDPPCGCRHQGEAIGVYGRGPWDNNRAAAKESPSAAWDDPRWGHRGGYQGTKAEKDEAMGIDWMNDVEIAQAIPPAYTEFIGRILLTHLGHAA